MEYNTGWGRRIITEDIVKSFFPDNYKVFRVNKDDAYAFELLSTSKSSICPNCGVESARLHGFQERAARDLPILGKRVTLRIVQKKYFCDNDECDTDIFTEHTDFIKPGSQFTSRCSEYMLKVATLVSCESAVKILTFQGIRVSGDTLLNMLKEAGKEYKCNVGSKIGVDDWAYRRGQSYGTLICDLETRDIVEVLEGRDSETLEKWLVGHPNIEVVSRDRASAYSSAVTKILPEAIQIADRFHITKNLLEALNKTMKGFLPEVIEIPCASSASLASSENVPDTDKAPQMLKKTRGHKSRKTSNIASKASR